MVLELYDICLYGIVRLNRQTRIPSQSCMPKACVTIMKTSWLKLFLIKASKIPQTKRVITIVNARLRLRNAGRNARLCVPRAVIV